MPVTFFPGIIQFAISPLLEISNAPKQVIFKCAPLTIPKLYEVSKIEAPGNSVTVSLPALIISGSS